MGRAEGRFSESNLPRTAILKRRRAPKFLRYLVRGSKRLFSRRRLLSLSSHHRRRERPLPPPRDLYDFPVVDKYGNVHIVSVPTGVREFSYNDLKEFTDGFSPANCWECEKNSTCSNVYRGRIAVDTARNLFKPVVVETWLATSATNSIWQAQLKLLMDPDINSLPNVVKLIGCCMDDDEDILGVVYDCQAMGTIRSMICDEQFTWARRVKAALQVSDFLSHLHNTGIVVCNLEPASILLDQDFNAVVFGLGMASGGYLRNRAQVGHPILICAFEFSCPIYSQSGYFTPSCDVFSLGALLLTLLTKSEVTAKYTDPLAQETIDLGEFSLHDHTERQVHCCFDGDVEYNSEHGLYITELAMRCVVKQPVQRPPMGEVINHLKSMSLVHNLRP